MGGNSVKYFNNETDYLDSFLKFLKNFRTNLFLKNLIADKYVSSLLEVNPKDLEKQGIEGVIWDVDGTLMEYHGKEVDVTLKEHFKAFSCLEQCILSNSNDARYIELSEIFPDIPVLRAYEQEDRIIYRKIFHGKDECFTFNGNQKISVEDIAEEAVIKKPSKALIDYALSAMRLKEPHLAATIGDNGFTDIAGGNQAGTYTIQIKPSLHPEKDPRGVKIAHLAEATITGMYRAYGTVKKETTLANLISIARPPLALYGLMAFENNPILLSSWITGTMVLDAVDGWVARKNGKSDLGGYVDVAADRAVELLVLFTYANRGLVPYAIPITFAIRGAATDFIRILNKYYPNSKFEQPLSVGNADNKYMRAIYGLAKTAAFATAPLSQALGTISAFGALGINLARGIPVLVSKRSRELIKTFYDDIATI